MRSDHLIVIDQGQHILRCLCSFAVQQHELWQALSPGYLPERILSSIGSAKKESTGLVDQGIALSSTTFIHAISSRATPESLQDYEPLTYMANYGSFDPKQLR